MPPSAPQQSGPLQRFFAERRGESVGLADLREALARAGTRVRRVFDQWASPGIPTVTIEHAVRKVGGRWRVSGKLGQEGTDGPFDLTLPVVALSGERSEGCEVALRSKRTSFQLVAPFEPERVAVDPDFTALVACPRSTIDDPDAVFSEAFRIVNSPGDADEAHNAHAIELLRSLLQAGLGNEGLCHGGIGRCLFRMRRYDDAAPELSKALALLGASQPFHRAWFHLRLGCIADLQGRREDALARYAHAREKGASQSTVERARRYEETPYRGFPEDG